MPALTDDEVRRRVLDAADQLFYARGVQAVGMDALRAEAGVPLKRLYQVFGSKEAVVEQVLTRRQRMWNDLVDAALASGGTPRDKLLAIYDGLAQWATDDDFRGCLFINTFGELGGTTPRVAEFVRAQKAEFQQRVAALVAEAGGSATLAAQLAILAEGVQTTTAIAGDNAAAAHARSAAEVLIGSALTSTTDHWADPTIGG
ncbi:TetR/AcrR family transcriptional regulator [Solwaraspora sp. WMMD792]|uniref:TetR/AcrR family transcriptional regulator n=1 Tax=Solwaraspora sp. WMMD792 TaxID=3016099 RepID=UPI002415EF97|nr:TetR/AcrR family transcriptional regulator [Solwaraspora sp. WMMD792]MDG4772874.1 TetR/AcrR family transcriptional regulator [Solwaraspora sp. WMMD792]